MTPTTLRQREIPVWVGWASVLWLAVWAPSYWIYWGPVNFLWLCDIAVLLTCLGLLSKNALLISSQAISALVIDLCWCLDTAWRWMFARHVFGGTEYMWDARFPLWLRLLSLYHVVWPFLLLWALGRDGYDRRGWLMQSGIAAVALVASRLFGFPVNLNYAFRDPIFHRAWGPAPFHLAVILIGLVAGVYWPTHLLLSKLFAPPGETA